MVVIFQYYQRLIASLRYLQNLNTAFTELTTKATTTTTSTTSTTSSTTPMPTLPPTTAAPTTLGPTTTTQNILQEAADISGIPTWGVVSIIIGKLNSFLCALFIDSKFEYSRLRCYPRNMLLLHKKMFPKAKSKGWQKGHQGCGFETSGVNRVFLQGKGNNAVGSRRFVQTLFKVQPDMDELTQNAEEPDESEKPEVQKLGKLQYKVMKFTGVRPRKTAANVI